MDTILQIAANESRVFVMCSKVKAGNFTTLVYSVLFEIGKSVSKMIGTL
jgi:hypothetical protein